jgi:hypothetical protein
MKISMQLFLALCALITLIVNAEELPMDKLKAYWRNPGAVKLTVTDTAYPIGNTMYGSYIWQTNGFLYEHLTGKDKTNFFEKQITGRWEDSYWYYTPATSNMCLWTDTSNPKDTNNFYNHARDAYINNQDMARYYINLTINYKEFGGIEFDDNRFVSTLDDRAITYTLHTNSVGQVDAIYVTNKRFKDGKEAKQTIVFIYKEATDYLPSLIKVYNVGSITVPLGRLVRFSNFISTNHPFGFEHFNNEAYVRNAVDKQYIQNGESFFMVKSDSGFAEYRTDFNKYKFICLFI